MFTELRIFIYRWIIGRSFWGLRDRDQSHPPDDGELTIHRGLWVGTFLKVATHQRLESKGVRQIAHVAGRLAEVEGLFAHRAAAMIRIEDQV